MANHYWTMVFPNQDVLNIANEQKMFPYSRRGYSRIAGQLKRYANTAGRDLNNIFKDYKTVVEPLINGKYTSKNQIEDALNIIVKNLKPNYDDCDPFVYEHPIIIKVGGVRIENVIKHTVDGSNHETTRSWNNPSSKEDVCTFWDGESDVTFNPDITVKKILGIQISAAQTEAAQTPLGIAETAASKGDMSLYDKASGYGGKRTRKYKCKNRNRSKHRVRLSKRSNN